MTEPWRDGDVVTFTDDKGDKHVAIRRDYHWKDGQWQVAIHGFWRVTDEFVTEHGTRMVEAKERTEVQACRKCGTAIYLHHKGDGPQVGGTGPDLSEHWRHIKGNKRFCDGGNGAIAEPYDDGGDVAQMLREILEAKS